jgi:hypothetical protein
MLVAIALHLGIEYAMVIPLFEWIAIATFVTFVYPEDLSRTWSWTRRHVGPYLGQPITLVYDTARPRAIRVATLLEAIDILGRLRFIDLRAPGTLVAPDVVQAAERGRIVALSQTGWHAGFDAIRTISTRVPLLWPLAPFALLAPDREPTAPAPTASA